MLPPTKKFLVLRLPSGFAMPALLGWQLRQDFILYAVCEEGLFLVTAQIFEKKNSDAFLRDSGRYDRRRFKT